MKKKNKLMVCVALFIILGGTMTSFAGEWKTDAKGWWWQNDDGSYPMNQWKEIDEKQYYFGADGYMLADTTTPDGYQVGADGAWIQSRQDEVQSNQYLDAYVAFLRSYKGSKRTSPKFHLLYIDGDAIPELAICDTDSYHGAPVDLYCYNQGIVQKFISAGQYGHISYIQGANLFCDAYAGAGGTHMYFCTLQNSTSVSFIQFECDISDPKYYLINSVPVTEDVYNNQLAAWNAIYTPVSEAGYSCGYTINETNIKKMLENIQNVMPKEDK